MLPRDCCALGMEHRVVGPGPYRATRLVSESGAEPTPRRCHRRDSGLCAVAQGLPVLVVVCLLGSLLRTLPRSGQTRPGASPTEVA